jgi:hypothetical protein
MKQELITSYKTQLKSSGDQKLVIPSGYDDRFWEWFTNNSKLFDLKTVRTKLRDTTIPIIDNNFCYKNTYRIAKGFVKRLYYFEGFGYTKQSDFCLRHAFNVCKNGKVNDYSLRNNTNNAQDYYIGVKIPLSFARKVYKEHGDHKYAQDSLLVPYFMHLNGLNDYLQYTEP